MVLTFSAAQKGNFPRVSKPSPCLQQSVTAAESFYLLSRWFNSHTYRGILCKAQGETLSQIENPKSSFLWHFDFYCNTLHAHVTASSSSKCESSKVKYVLNNETHKRAKETAANGIRTTLFNGRERREHAAKRWQRHRHLTGGSGPPYLITPSFPVCKNPCECSSYLEIFWNSKGHWNEVA